MLKLKHILVLVFLALPIFSYGQIKIVPKESLDSLVNPQLSSDAKFMKFETTYLEAQEMWEDDEPKIYKFSFTNISDKPLVLYNIRTNCSCVRPLNVGAVIKAGEKGEIILAYYPDGHPGEFLRRIYVYTNTEKLPSAFLRIEVTVKERK